MFLNPFEHGEVINYTQLLEKKETAQGFLHEANGDFKTFTEFNGCDRRTEDGSTTLKLPHNINLIGRAKRKPVQNIFYSKTCFLFATRQNVAKQLTFLSRKQSVMFGANPIQHITECHSPYFQA